MKDDTYTPTEILKRIQAFNEKYPDAPHSYAHLVLGDFNLGDSSVVFCLHNTDRYEWLKQVILDVSRTLPAKEYLARIDQLWETNGRVFEFLVWLSSVDEDIRNDAMALAHGELIE